MKKTIFKTLSLVAMILVASCTKEGNDVKPELTNRTQQRPNADPCQNQEADFDDFDKVAKYVSIGLSGLSVKYPMIIQHLKYLNAQNNGNAFPLESLINIKCPYSPTDVDGQIKDFGTLLGEEIKEKCTDVKDAYEPIPYDKYLTTELLSNAIHNGKRYSINLYLPDYKASKATMPFYFGHLVKDNQNKIQSFHGTSTGITDYGYDYSDTLTKNIVIVEPGKVTAEGVTSSKLNPCGSFGYVQSYSWGGNNGNGSNNSTNDLDKSGPIVEHENGLMLKITASNIFQRFEATGKSQVRAAGMLYNPSNLTLTNFSSCMEVDNCPKSQLNTFRNVDCVLTNNWDQNIYQRLFLVIYEKDWWTTPKEVRNNQVKFEVQMKFKDETYLQGTYDYSFFNALGNLVTINGQNGAFKISVQ